MRPPSRVKAYPRACGGASLERMRQDLQVGLSPRLRGSLIRSRRRVLSIGPIPAPAGEPQAIIQLVALKMAYPRACGGAKTGFRKAK